MRGRRIGWVYAALSAVLALLPAAMPSAAAGESGPLQRLTGDGADLPTTPGSYFYSSGGLFSAGDQFLLFRLDRINGLDREATWYVVRDLSSGTQNAYPLPVMAPALDYGLLPVALSADGRSILVPDFRRLVDADTNDARDLYWYDLADGSATLVSTDAEGKAEGFSGDEMMLSDDGKFLAYSDASASVDTAVYRRDLATGDTVTVGVGRFPRISGDGSVITLTSAVQPGAPSWATAVYAWDAASAVASRVSPAPDATGVPFYDGPTVSADGQTLAFVGHQNGAQVYVYRRSSGQTQAVAVTPAGQPSQGTSSASPELSADGRYVVFASTAEDLVVNDANGETDVFRRDLLAGRTERVSVAVGGPRNDGGASLSAVADSGRTIAVQMLPPGFYGAGSPDYGSFLRTYGADAGAAETALAGGLSSPTRSTRPELTFTSATPAATFQCQADAGAWVTCASPFLFDTLVDGRHDLAVRAVSVEGVPDPTPASAVVVVDTKAPDTKIRSGPAKTSTNRKPVLKLTATEPGSRFMCQLDKRAWGRCSATWKPGNLSRTKHVVRVWATDPAGNLDPTPAKLQFRIK